MALGDDVQPDYRALPRATYTDPEAASVGLTLDQAKADGIDAFEFVADFATSSQGYAVEAKLGHVTMTFDRATRQLVGAAMACPDASAAIHECVLAIRARVPVEVLADTIHAFPSTSRILNGLFAEAVKELAPSADRLAGLRRAPRTRPRRRPGRAAGGPSRARRRARSGGVSALDREDDEVGALAGDQPAAVRLRRRSTAGPTHAARSACSSVSASSGPNGALPGRPRPVDAGHGHRQARPRVDRLDRRVGPEREDRAGVEQRPPRVAVRLGPVAPQRPRGRGVGPEVDRLDRGRDPGPREPRPVVRVEQLDVLEARHERRSGRRVGSSASRAARQAPVADRVDLSRDPGVGRPAGELGDRAPAA